MTDRKPRRRISFQAKIDALKDRRSRLMAQAARLDAAIENLIAEHKAKAKAMLEEAGE